MTVIFQTTSVIAGVRLVQMPVGTQNFVQFDFHNDSVYECGISFGQQNGTGIEGCDFFMEPHTILEDVEPPSSSKYTVNKSWHNGPIYLFFKLPGGGTILAAQAPAAEFTIVGYPIGVKTPTAIPLNRMQNVGNVVQNVSGVASSVQDDGRTGSPFTLEATVDSEVQPSVTLTNDATMVLGNSSNPSRGILTVYRELFVNLAHALALNDLALEVDNNQRIVLNVNNTDIFSVDNTTSKVLTNTFSLPFGLGIKGISNFGIYTVGTTQATFNHNMAGLSGGDSPSLILVQLLGTSSTSAIIKVDSTTMTNTTFKATGSLAGLSFWGLALKF